MSLGKVKVCLWKDEMLSNVDLQVKMLVPSNLKRIDTTPTGSGTGTVDKKISLFYFRHAQQHFRGLQE
jgi:hypothetical protein